MKNTYIQKRRKQGGFTLLELLVVVGILAIIAGAIITAYDGFQERAARQTGLNTIASMTNTIRAFQTTGNQRALPNNVETLIVATPTGAAAVANTNDIQSTTAPTTPAIAPFLSTPLVQKLTNGTTAPAPQNLGAVQAQALFDAGVTQFRYVDVAQVSGTVAASGQVPLGLPALDDSSATPQVPALVNRTEMQTIFSPPVSGADNLGAGYAYVAGTAAAVQNAPLMIWGGQTTTPTTVGQNGNPDVFPENFENTIVGADSDAVLVCLGIGKESTLVNGNSNQDNVANLASAPFYGAVDVNDYNHFIMLVDVNVPDGDRAQFIGVVDPNGNALNEGATGGSN